MGVKTNNQDWSSMPSNQLEQRLLVLCNRDWEGMAPLSIEGWKRARQLGTFEIVEVKNRSPFRSSASGGYMISDAGPASFVRPCRLFKKDLVLGPFSCSYQFFSCLCLQELCCTTPKSLTCQ